MGPLVKRLVNFWRNRTAQKLQQEFEEQLKRDYLKLRSLEADPVRNWDRLENMALIGLLGIEEGEANEAGKAGV